MLLEKSEASKKEAERQKGRFAHHMGTLFMNHALIQAQQKEIQATDKILIKEKLSDNTDPNLTKKILSLRSEIDQLEKENNKTNHQEELEIAKLEKNLKKYKDQEEKLKSSLKQETNKNAYASLDAASNAGQQMDKWKVYMAA